MLWMVRLLLWLFVAVTVVAEEEDVLVSPIVQRQLETSVVAHSWPWTIHNVYCEAWAFQQELPTTTDNENISFMDHLVEDLSQRKAVESVQDATGIVLEAARKSGLDEGIVSLLKYSLTLRAYSPTCEAHRGLAKQMVLDKGLFLNNTTTWNNAFAIHDGAVVTHPSQFESLYTDKIVDKDDVLLPGEKVLKCDHRKEKQQQLSNGGVAILYGNMGTSDFWNLYLTLRDSCTVDLVVRHLGVMDESSTTTTASPTVLQGYGVRLDIRNVEYRAFDDEGKDNANDEKLNVTALDSSIVPNMQLAGVNLSAIALQEESKTTVLQQELWKRHQAQQLHSQLIPPKWQRRQLPLQAAAAIVASQGQQDKSNKDALLTLLDTSQNLPSVASTLVHVVVSEEMEELANSIQSLGLLRQAGALLLVNGKRVPIDRPSFNVFELLKLLLKEQAELDSMQQQLRPYLNNNPQALQQVYNAWIQGDAAFSDNNNEDDKEDADASSSLKKSVFRIDVGRGWKQAIMYLNDIEKDPQYRQWPNQLQQMMFGMQFGQPPAVRRNLFTILAVVDPLSFQKETTGLPLGMQTIKSHYAVRTGILLVNEQDVQECAAWLTANPNVDDGEPCPEPPIFQESSLPMDMAMLSEIEATTQMLHRIVSQVMSMYAGSGAAVAYVDYLLQLLEQHMDEGGEPCLASDLLHLHGQVMGDLNLMESQQAVARGIKALQDSSKGGDKSGDGPLYGKALRFAVDKNVKPGMSFVNGRPLPLVTEEDADERAGQLFMEEQSYLFDMIMSKEITDSSPRSIYGKLLSGDGVFKRVHPLLTESSENSYIDLPQHKFGKDAIVFPKEHGQKDDADAVFVVDVVVDYNTDVGLEMATNMVDVMDTLPSSIGDDDEDDNGSKISVGYRFLPSTKESAANSLCPIFAHAGLLDPASVLALVQAARDGKSQTKDLVNSMKSVSSDVRKRLLATADEESPCTDLPYLGEELPSSNFVVANGRLYVPDSAVVTKEDAELLLSIDLAKTEGVTKLLKPHLSPQDVGGYHNAINRVTSFLAKQSSGSERMNVESELMTLEDDLDLEQNPFRFSWNVDDSSSDNGSLKVKVTAVVDPISEATQRLAPLLFVFRDELKLPLSLILAPPSSGGDEGYPIASYYRFVADPKATPDVNPARAHFENLPTNHILTLRMDVPEPWNVQQTYSVQDTDNLRCDVSSGCGDDAHKDTVDDSSVPIHERQHMTSVEYGLKDLLFFGQCYDATMGSPPNGLQLTLSTGSDADQEGPERVEISHDGTVTPLSESSTEPTHYSDTLVMKTVGYWQLRATPGVWKLAIAEGSRGAEIFDMVDGNVQYGKIKVNKSSNNTTTKTLVMKDFVNSGELLLVKRRPGFERASLFYDDESKDKEEEEEEEVINVFSLATGHLYERFLKIMMLSVTKRTSSKVKFWLFENFLSPSFKATAIDMAEKIGCEVEFVTYKWPEWLRGQSEKQRIIWGYKILFLDVLFPLGVKKIIYVDADQVVRGDLKELWDLDLQGAPYGYTPFCDSRETTLGFQFWRTGFWESHLRGKPYHISALYVVDLEKFRHDLVGDQLRSFYQQLSADPNSLSNLDQDLPNYAQHAVPIFSLPQEWLWCESWCSDETKASAKTIDLCNNPLHKEPKVSMAKRIISGELFNESWIELDAEVDRYEKAYLDSLPA